MSHILMKNATGRAGPSEAFLLALAMGFQNFRPQRSLGDNPVAIPFFFFFLINRWGNRDPLCKSDFYLRYSGQGRANVHGTCIFGPDSRTLGISTGAVNTHTEYPRLLGGSREHRQVTDWGSLCSCPLGRKWRKPVAA